MTTLSNHAWGNYGALLREMPLNPAMLDTQVLKAELVGFAMKGLGFMV